MKKVLMATIALAAILPLGACASDPGATLTETARSNIPSEERFESAPRDYVSPYTLAIECVRDLLTPAMKKVPIGVAYFIDGTGKEGYSQDGASGKFLSQRPEDMLMNRFQQMGLSTVEGGDTMNHFMERQVKYMPKLQPGDPNPGWNVVLPSVMFAGSFTTFDFGSGHVNELYVAGIGGGVSKSQITYTLSARGVLMPGSVLPDGRRDANVDVAKVDLTQDIVGHEVKAGVTSYFGPVNSPTYVELNLDNQKRELMQFSQRYVVDITAVKFAIDLFHIDGCQKQIEYGNALITGYYPKDLYVPKK